MNKQMITALLAMFIMGATNLLGAVSLHAQEKKLSPDEAVEMAIKNNLNLESARIGTDVSKRKYTHFWNQFLPSVNGTATLARDNYPTIPSIPPWFLTTGVSATLDFSFALVEGIKSYRLDYEAGLISYEKAKLQIEQGVRKMYNSILLMEANTELMNESFNNARRQAATAEANYRAGLVPRLTWIQAQVAVENMRPSISELENSLKNLKGNFAMLLGLPSNTPISLQQITFEAVNINTDVTELLTRAASEKPDVQELRAKILTLKSQKKAMSLQAYTPFLRLGWNLNPTFNPILDPFNDSLFTGDNWNKEGNFSITLGVNLNSIFSFTKEGQQRKDMDANIQIQNIRLAQMIQEIELEVITKLNSLEKILSTLEAQTVAVELAELAYTLTEEAYRAGLQDFQAVQSSALALEQARLQLLMENFNYMNDLLDLEYSIGVPFGTLNSIQSSSTGGR